jgi:uncharacterized cupredoxin-like copper-binding protein
MKKIQFTLAAIAMAASGLVFAQSATQPGGMGMMNQGAMNQDPMAAMCQKMHPEMSPDQCKAMHENMGKMTPEQRVAMCQQMHPEMSASQCKAMHDKMQGSGAGMGAMNGMGAMSHDHGVSGGHNHGSESSSIGQPGIAKNVSRTIQVGMTDNMKFNPNSLQVKQGETIRFVVKNMGKTKHEMVLGTDQDLKEHYKQMMKFPEMEHAEPNMVSLGANQTGEIIWQFTKSGKVQFACLQPGHYDAGMKGSISIGVIKSASPAQKGDGHGSHQH